MKLVVRREGEVLVLAVSGRVAGEAFRDAVDPVLEGLDPTVRGVAVDLDRAEHLSSAGLASFVWLKHELDDRGIALRLAGPREAVRRVIDSVMLDRLIPIDAELPHAVAVLRGWDTRA